MQTGIPYSHAKTSAARYSNYLIVLLGILTAFGPLVTDMYLPTLPSMTVYFGTSQSMVQMGLTASMAGLALGQLLFGPLSDKFGRRPLLLVSLLLFVASTVICIFSPTVYVFVGMRLFQGIGAAGGIVISRSVATDRYRGKELVKVLAVIGVINGIAPVAAPVLGGVLTDAVGWRGIFVILLAIGVTACCVGLNDTIEQNTSSAAPYDVTIQNYSGDTTVADLPARLAESGFDPALLGEQHDFLFYYNDPAVTGIPADDAYAVVLLSDYNALMALQGGQALAGDGLPLVTDQAIVTGYSGMNRYLVAPDSWAEALQVRRQVFCANYRGDKQTAEDALAAAYSSPAFSDGLTLSLDTRIGIYTENMGSKILVLFMGLYLGMVFLLTAAAVLALQQLSQAADNVPRYQILSRLGVPERMRDRSVLTQVALSFFLPLALAVVHSIVGMTAANAVISVVGRVDSVRSSLVTAGFLVLIYGAYFLATCFGARRIVKGNG